ncbi:MAG TPA: gamma-glutamyltransferase family protein [Oscillospiraceae bacterium]|nr:gamma-glutamyltransferase family protein [Oscillospiraceae bacterium]
MNYIPTYAPYRSVRYPVYAGHGMVCASSAQASAAGLEILRRGGNAMDAAVATAAALTVTEPTANGIGGDAFALVWVEGDKRLYGLNASGVSPKSLTLDAARARCPDGKMPTYGWLPTMVPGAPGGWAALSRRFGRLSMTETLKPAVSYAQDGYPAGANLARMWKRALTKYQAACTAPEFRAWYDTFAPGGRAPEAGERIRLPGHAKALQAIAETDAKAFYEGEIADAIVAESDTFGGFYRKEDFSTYAPEWVEPISVNYRGCDVWEIPPNGQGITALMALNILKEFPFPEKESVSTYHTQWEAMKIAFADAMHHVTDPRAMRIDYHDLIRPAYGALRAKEIGPTAGSPGPMDPPRSGTVYFCTADGEGNMVSFIQSNYMGFGSGIVIPGWGVSLQNRGHDFSLDETAANVLAPGKKCYHTIIPGFLTKDGEALGPFGVMGGYMQPQGHVQVVMNLLDFALGPQQALDAPRWQWIQGNTFQVEDTFPNEIAKQLAARGHTVEVALDNVAFGRGQIILRGGHGTLVGGTESRTDSNIACY